MRAVLPGLTLLVAVAMGADAWAYDAYWCGPGRHTGWGWGDGYHAPRGTQWGYPLPVAPVSHWVPSDSLATPPSPDGRPLPALRLPPIQDAPPIPPQAEDAAVETIRKLPPVDPIQLESVRTETASSLQIRRLPQPLDRLPPVDQTGG